MTRCLGAKPPRSRARVPRRPPWNTCDHQVVQRPPEDEQGRNYAIQYLLLLVPKVEGWLADAERDETGPDTMTPDPGSSLGGDDRDTEPYQISHAATTGIAVAIDHLRCLLQSVVSGAGTPDVQIITRPWALYSLLRGAAENAATAIWLLAPRSRAERLTRRVRLALQDAMHADDVLRLTGRRACSGIAHGDTWALSSLPTHEVLNDSTAAVLNTRVTLDISQLAAWTRRAVRLIEEAHACTESAG
jgi:hypothetical protein